MELPAPVDTKSQRSWGKLPTVIDKAGTWWTGRSFEDLAEYIRIHTSLGYPAGDIRRCVCGDCGGHVFGLDIAQAEGCAQRICVGCLNEFLIADSEDYWDQVNIETAACPCGYETFEIGVGYSLRESGEIRWVTVAGRCVVCGILGVYTDWKIDYEPSRHLLDRF